MDNIKEIKTEKFTGLAVLVPDYYVSSFCNMGYLVVKVENEKTFIGEDEMFPPDKLQKALDRVNKLPEHVTIPAIKLPDGEYKVIGNTLILTEEQCAEIVESGMDYTDFGYFNYQSVKSSFYKYPYTALESLSSLMQSIGCEQGKQYVILRRV